ncbi:DUF4160 domain-containing protein [Dyadobacter aurulentus]|uniref:DUF4160 domain-containing protein n=1 Tax=Dyadobacter sp. UC 10 TaxID=2605428 RepID=UPI0011F33985|nr:DUF4160 domain-containing protein [Dyadobacter sp. UC 10]KAA0991177.1 DUF4160 domain-containing protein [Dyadobacter sp. UC 10]
MEGPGYLVRVFFYGALSGEAKFEVNHVKLIDNKGIKRKDISLAESLIEENKEIIIAKWKEYHGN